MSSAVLKAVLSLCLVFPLFVACEEEPNRLDSRKTNAAPPGTVAQSTATSGYIEHTVQGLILRKDEDVVHIEEAKLQRGAGGDVDLIFVEAVMRGATKDRDCFLMEGPDWFATERVIETGDVSHQPRRMESLWADEELSTEEFFSGNKYTKIFQEDEHQEERAADPRETPFFALCFKDVLPSGTDRSTTWYDVAHVEGTPGAS